MQRRTFQLEENNLELRGVCTDGEGEQKKHCLVGSSTSSVATERNVEELLLMQTEFV